MKIMKLDVKTPQTGVKTAEGVPLWIDSVVTVQVYSSSSIITEEEWRESGAPTPEALITQRQQAAISNFLGAKEPEFNDKVNDILQGNLREIVAEMTVMDVLTKRKEFAARVMDNAKPDLAKIGLEVVTFNIQDIQDAVDACGKKHGVVEAIGIEREMEVRRTAEVAKANAMRDITIAQAEANREAEEKKALSDVKIAEARTAQSLREAELRTQRDRAQEMAASAGQIQKQMQEKIRREAEADVEIAAQAKEILRAEKEAEVKQRQLDAEVRKQADAEKYKAQQMADAQKYAFEAAAAAEKKKRELDAEAELFEITKAAEAKKIAAEAELIAAQRKAEGIAAIGRAEAEAIEAKGLAEAQAIEKKAEAQQKMGEASKLEMMYNVLPQVAQALASILNGADNVTLYGTDTASNLMSSMTQGLNQFMKSVQDGTGNAIDGNILAGSLVGANLAGNMANKQLPQAPAPRAPKNHPPRPNPAAPAAPTAPTTPTK
jgi:flotillin